MKTLHEWTDDLYRRFESLRAAPGTLARLKVAMNLFIPYLEQQRVTHPETLTVEHIHGFQAYLSQRRTRKGMPMKPAAINTVIKGVRSFLELLDDHGCLRRPLAKKLDYVREPNLLPTSVLTHAQVRKLLRKVGSQSSEDVRDRAALELMYSSGLRIGELVGITLPDLDLETGVVRVIGKGQKERFVPIGKTALKWLRSYVKGVRPFLHPEQSPAVFLTRNGTPLPAHRLRTRVRELGKGMKLDIPITPHTLRRSCTSELVKSNANLYHIKQLLGHESFETLNRYARLNIADLRKTHAKCHPRERDEQ
ncbi:MAG: tyrosine-type recombinase/integrase [Kiritimatiellae bacterium]|jgi:site-specific recombinase XerD|nr:tyrosine-type recombinase/integrase [Kiritimatiellia bacterium]